MTKMVRIKVPGGAMWVRANDIKMIKEWNPDENGDPVTTEVIMTEGYRFGTDSTAEEIITQVGTD